MGYLLHILAAIGIQAIGEGDWNLGVRSPWALVPLLALPYLLARRTRALALGGRFARAARWERLVRYSAPLAYAIAVCVFGWVQSVRAWTGGRLTLSSWPEPAMLLSLAPFVVYELAAIDASTRIEDAPPHQRRRLRAFHLRMFLSGLAPLLIYLVLASGVGWNPVVRAHVEGVAVWNAVFVVVLLALLGAGLPSLLRNTWETAPLEPGPQRGLLEAVGQRAGFQASELLVWRTGHLMANAAIVGFLPRTRVVLLSDSLLSILSLRELAAVYAHEIGHAVRRHVLVFIGWALAFFLGADLLTTWWRLDGPLEGAVFVLALAAVWYYGFGWLSRRCELEADLYSLELLGDAEALASALERVGGRLRDVTGWRHFSTSKRIAFLERAASDSGFIRRFRRGLRRWAVTGGVLAVAAIGWQVVQLAKSFTEDGIYVELGLGRYATAHERALAAGEVDRDLVQLSARALELERSLGRAVEVDDVVAAVDDSLAQGDLERAFALAQLGALRGRMDLGELALELDVALAGDPAQARRFLDERASRWRARLAQ